MIMLNGGIFPDRHRPQIIQKLLMGPLKFLIAMLISKSRMEKSMKPKFRPGSQPTQGVLDIFWKLIIHNNGLAIAYLLSRYRKERFVPMAKWQNALIYTDIPMRLINGPNKQE